MPANKPIRRSHLIGYYGIGAMVDFPHDETLMTAGLDAWHLAFEECEPNWLVGEERLQHRLHVSHFRLPPEHLDPGPGVKLANINMPSVRFPRWHYCPRCGYMEQRSLFDYTTLRCKGREYQIGRSCTGIPDKKRFLMIPVRIVAVCGKGHIQDFPFMEWVHRDRAATKNCTLRWVPDRPSTTMANVRIECTCGANNTLSLAFEFFEERGGPLHRIGIDCRGDRPWLGECDNRNNPCGEYLRVVQRGASNVYFPYVISSIYLPPWIETVNKSIIDALENPRIWGILTEELVEGRSINQTQAKTVAKLVNVDADKLIDAAQKKLDGVASQIEACNSEEAHRFQEYVALSERRDDVNSGLLVEITEVQEYGNDLARLLSKVCLVRKLRETRVLAGFTRLLPPDSLSEDDRDRIQSLSIDSAIDWLPAVVVHGEGIFLELDAQAIDNWMANSGCENRLADLLTTYVGRRTKRGLKTRTIPPKFVMMHTLAHMLINQLSYDCGYGSASLRERIYCDFDNNDNPMQGILIYTAAGDSEGTLGGLVRQGEPDCFRGTLLRALNKALWCSSDPVCMESTGQGVDNANLAACHGCVLVSETSCEEGNRLLDRALVVGKPDNPKLGFFSSIL